MPGLTGLRVIGRGGAAGGVTVAGCEAAGWDAAGCGVAGCGVAVWRCRSLGRRPLSGRSSASPEPGSPEPVAGARSLVAGAAAPGFTLIVPVGVCARNLDQIPQDLRWSSAAATSETTPQ